MNTIIYKKNLKTIISHFLFLIGGSITVIIGYVFLYFKFGYFGGLPLLVGGIFFSFYLIPALFLHIEYSFLDRKTVITFFPDEKLYIYNNSKISFEFNNNDIKTITRFKDKVGWYSTSSFYYIKLELYKHTDSYIITSYVLENLLIDKKIKAGIIKKNRLIPSPFLEKIFEEKQT